jgi:hypothetical protein
VHTSEQVALGLLVPVGSSLVFVYAMVAALGWWRPVFVVAILVAINYGGLAVCGLGFTALLLLAART